MNCVSFNVNSIRQRLHQLQAVIDQHQPDFIGLQETKVTDEEFPVEAIRAMGYHVEFTGQKTHYGVALLSRLPFASVQKGFTSDADDAQTRFISGCFDLPGGRRLNVINGYFPQGENREHPVKFPNKRRYYSDLLDHLEEIDKSELLIVMGDVNVSHQDIDIGIGEDNRKRWLKTGKCSFLPEEREWFQALLDWGLADTYRIHHPDDSDYFSWFDYRSRGFEREPKRGLRIDVVLASQPLAERCTGAGINYSVRAMERPSDHCPVWAEFDLESQV
jgi:exodeoxyribonuclease-3